MRLVNRANTDEGGLLSTIRIKPGATLRDRLIILQGFLCNMGMWRPGSRTGAYAGHRVVPPDFWQANAFSMSGACQRLFEWFESVEVACLLSAVNYHVFDIPVTGEWEQYGDVDLSDIRQLIEAAVMVCDLGWADDFVMADKRDPVSVMIMRRHVVREVRDRVLGEMAVAA